MAICTTIEPTPPLPPLTKIVSPGFQLGFAEQAQMGRDADQGTGGGVFVVHVGRRGIEPLLIDGAVLGKRALPAHQPLVRSPDAVAHLESLRLRPHGFDRAGQVAADDERLGQLPIVRAVAEVRVDRD